jgi:hypothetical protein
MTTKYDYFIIKDHFDNTFYNILDLIQEDIVNKRDEEFSQDFASQDAQQDSHDLDLLLRDIQLKRDIDRDIDANSLLGKRKREVKIKKPAKVLPSLLGKRKREPCAADEFEE